MKVAGVRKLASCLENCFQISVPKERCDPGGLAKYFAPEASHCNQREGFNTYGRKISFSISVVV